MNETLPIVFVVDDESAVGVSIKRLLHSVGLEARHFTSASEFLRAKRPDAPGCIVLDVRLPDLSGLDLQQELAKANVGLPVIFVTGHADIPMTVRAMKAGAVEFLMKPFSDETLLSAIRQAIDQSRAALDQQQEIKTLRDRYALLSRREQELLEAVQRAISRHRQILDQRASMRVLQSRYELLTPREREVYPLVAGGLLNKQVAAELNASEKTIKVHRGQLMQKMEAHSLSDLIRMAEQLGVLSPRS